MIAHMPRRLLPLLAPFVLCAPLQAGFLGLDQERKLGRQVADELEKQYGLVRGDAMVDNVRKVGGKVAVFAEQDRPKIDYQFNVLADKEINAVACPGGYMYAFRGLVKKMPEEDYLAAVLAHECAHVAKRHGMNTLERSLGFSVLLGILTGATDSDLGNIGLNILMRGYSRDQEADADRTGQVYLFKAGYPIDAMTGMLGRLKELSGGAEGTPNFLRTHPSDESRIRAAQQREAEILLDLGSERPAVDPPRLAIVYQPPGSEATEVARIGEGLGKQLSAMLTGSAQFRTESAGARASTEADRVAALAQVAADRGLDGAIGLSFTEPPLRTEGDGKKAPVKIRMAVTMTVVAAGATQSELLYSYATKEATRSAGDTKKIEALIQSQTEETARALAVAVLRPQAVPEQPNA